MAADAYKFELTGLTKVSLGAVGTAGTMGATLVDYLVKDGTANITIAEPTSTDVFIYQSDDPYAVLKSNSPKEITMELLGLKLSQLPTFMGGTFTPSVTTVKDKWSAPVTIPDLFVSAKFVSEESGGNPVGLGFIRCQILSSMAGAISKTDLIGIKVKLKVLTPVDISGVALPSWFIEGSSVS
jgi:hypothetical protein